MASSLAANGQLVPVKVRASRSGQTAEYELIYGHRRMLAARKLGWKTIRAEIVDVDDENSSTQSLVENFGREDLSDYEKAIALDRICTSFHKTHQEVANLLGISKQSVSNYISMLKLFDPSVCGNADVLNVLYHLTEHHARILLRVGDYKLRMELASLVVREQLSVRELHRIASRLRSWFTPEQGSGTTKIESQAFERDKAIIVQMLEDELELARKEDFDALVNHHAAHGFSMYSAFPPFDLLEGKTAASALSDRNRWIFQLASNPSEITDLTVNIFGKTALATYTTRNKQESMMQRGTIVYVKHRGAWRMFHGHFSLANNMETTRVS
jgi:ParB/RepB/Spo0J family partition protein